MNMHLFADEPLILCNFCFPEMGFTFSCITFGGNKHEYKLYIKISTIADYVIG